MKTNKKQVYEFLRKYHMEEQDRGASTQYLSKTLGIGRSNVSAILNTLVQEGVIGKSEGRPVLYYAIKEGRIVADSCFTDNLVGADGSLRHAVQLAKAAVYYPRHSLNTLICGAPGTGKKLLAMLMHSYGVKSKVFPAEASYQFFDCRRYQSDEERYQALFGWENDLGVYGSVENGVLVIDNVQLLTIQTYAKVIDQIEHKNEWDKERGTPLQVILLYETSQNNSSELRKSLSITIELPSLKDRPMMERKALVQKFLAIESARAQRTIVISAEVLRCLLLYEADSNIARLKYDIKVGCANAYVREHCINANNMNLYMSDFENRVRKGFLHYHANREELEQIIPADYNYEFDESTIEMADIDRNKLSNQTLYKMIARRSKKLKKMNFSDEDINVILSSELELHYKTYQKQLVNKVTNDNQLSQLVDARVIKIVRSFLNEGIGKQGNYPDSLFYGLCLHLDTSLKNGWKNVRFTSERIHEIRENYKSEYALSQQLAAAIEEEFHKVLPIEEIILITMFLTDEAAPADTTNKPVILYVFRNTDIAKALTALINQTLKLNNAFYFEIPIEQESATFYDELKRYILLIERGKGVLIFYDSGYMQNIITMVEVETDIRIRKSYLPITDFVLEMSQRAATEDNIDVLYSGIMEFVSHQNQPVPNVIVTLCATGEGGATELKRYIEQYVANDAVKVVTLATSNREELREKLSQIMEYAKIQCFVGTYDPRMFGIPFVPVSEVFSSDPEKLFYILSVNRQEKEKQMERIDYEEIFQYMAEHLELVDISKLKKILPKVLTSINTEIVPLSSDTEIGLFLHIPCSIERLLEKEKVPICAKKSQIIKEYGNEYKKLLKILKPLEKTFSVIFNDDEIAVLLTIIFKL